MPNKIQAGGLTLIASSLALLLSSSPAVAEDLPREAPVPSGFQRVTLDDCGVAKQEPHYVFSGTGGDYAWPTNIPGAAVPDDPRFNTILHGNPTVVFSYSGLRPSARYFLKVFYYNPLGDRSVQLAANGVELHGAFTPTKKAVIRSFELPPRLYRRANLTLVFTRVTGDNAVVSAVELWSDQAGLIEAVGSFVRFRVERLPEGQPELKVTAAAGGKPFSLTPEAARAPGFTPWVDLRKTPCGANGLLKLSIPPGARGATQFGLVQDDQAIVREIDWSEPDGDRFFVTPGFEDIHTLRDQERRYYLQTAGLARNRLFPLTRPPLLFANAWGWITGGAAEYMVKSFRLLGLNCVATSADLEKYEALYGWGSQGAHYQPPTFMPYDPTNAFQLYLFHYRQYFQTGEGHQKFSSPGLRSFQLSDEPQEAGLKGDAAQAGFRKWLAEQGLKPGFFGKDKWEEVALNLGAARTPEEQRLFYWSRRYQGRLTPKMFGLASEAFCRESPSRTVKTFVGLSGHQFYLTGNRMPLDMFQLAQYPDMMPGISDWMVEAPGGWFWDSHQSVAFSVAPFNGGARRYGADFGRPPISFPMMHCVFPSLFRAYTQLANQCKLISYYNYGPDYMGYEGAWSGRFWCRYTVHHINNQASLADDILGPGQMRPSRVALLYSMSTEYRWPQVSFADKRATFLALSHDYYQPELVNEDQIAAGALQHYDALYVLDPWVAAPAQAAIEAWVKKGGLLWASAESATKNEYDEPADLLQRLAGLERGFSGNLSANALTVSPVKGYPAFNPHKVSAAGRPISIACQGARILATYGDGVPAWLERKVQKGKLVYVGHRAGLAYRAGAGKYKDECIWPDDRRSLINQPLSDAQVPREMTISEPMVLAMPLSTAAGTVIPVYNMHKSWPHPRGNLVFKLREPKAPVSVQYVLAGELKLADLPFDHKDGWLTTTLPDLPFDGTLLVVRRTPAPPDDRIEIMRQAAAAHLASADWQTLSAGAWFAGFFPAWKLGPKLEPLLAHEHWAVRRSAAESLGRLGDPHAAQALRKAVELEKDPHALADEIAALALLGHRDAPALCRTLREHGDTFREAEGARIAALLKP